MFKTADEKQVMRLCFSIPQTDGALAPQIELFVEDWYSSAVANAEIPHAFLEAHGWLEELPIPSRYLRYALYRLAAHAPGQRELSLLNSRHIEFRSIHFYPYPPQKQRETQMILEVALPTYLSTTDAPQWSTGDSTSVLEIDCLGHRKVEPKRRMVIRGKRNEDH